MIMFIGLLILLGFIAANAIVYRRPDGEQALVTASLANSELVEKTSRDQIKKKPFIRKSEYTNITAGLPGF